MMLGLSQLDTSGVPVGSGPIPDATYQTALDQLPIYTPNETLTAAVTPQYQVAAQNNALTFGLLAFAGLILFLGLHR